MGRAAAGEGFLRAIRARVLTSGGMNGTRHSSHGAVAQLGERLNGIQEVVGSIPSSSTK